MIAAILAKRKIIFAVLGIAVIAFACVQTWRLSNAHTKIGVLKGEKAALQANNTELADYIAKQNASIAELSEKARQAAQERDKALAEAERLAESEKTTTERDIAETRPPENSTRIEACDATESLLRRYLSRAAQPTLP